jgi:DNA-binding MarR family transcriptional regulator
MHPLRSRGPGPLLFLGPPFVPEAAGSRAKIESVGAEGVTARHRASRVERRRSYRHKVVAAAMVAASIASDAMEGARPLSGRELAAWRAFLRAHATLMGTLGRELEAQRGMPIAFYDVLTQLAEADGGRLRMRELAEAVLLSRSGLTRLVDRMERAGYVTRERCVDDRRGAFAMITAAGRKALRRASPVHARGVVEHFVRHLSREETDVLAGALERVVDAQPRS